MIKIKFITVGKIKEKSLKTIIDEYLKRLTRYAKIESVELNDLPVPENPSESESASVLEKEGAEILKHISARACIVTLCIEGKKFSSEQFAHFLEKTHNEYSELIFVVGSSHGLSDNVKNMRKGGRNTCGI